VREDQQPREDRTVQEAPRTGDQHTARHVERRKELLAQIVTEDAGALARLAEQ
jgi:hypothetical protein